MEETSMQIIGHVHTDFPTKFGLPRQSGLIEELVGRIELKPEFRRAEAFRGIEEFSHLWILWQFSLSQKEHWSATVKPPRLGGKKAYGSLCHALTLSPQSHWTVLCQVIRRRLCLCQGTGTLCGRGRYGGWHAHL